MIGFDFCEQVFGEHPLWEPPGAGRIVSGILEHSEVRRLFRI
jgi:hypothetical protein